MAPNGLNASVHIGLLPSKLTTLKNNSSKRSLNVDSPSFTPTAKNATPIPAAKIGISPKAAAAATFTPRGSGELPHRLETRQQLTFGRLGDTSDRLTLERTFSGVYTTTGVSASSTVPGVCSRPVVFDFATGKFAGIHMHVKG